MDRLSVLQVAQKHMNAWMQKHNATLDEVARILLLSRPLLCAFSDQKGGGHLYAEMIVRAFGVGVEQTTRKLMELRGGDVDDAAPGTSSPAPMKPFNRDVGKGDHLPHVEYTMALIDEVAKKTGMTITGLSRALGRHENSLHSVRNEIRHGKFSDGRARILNRKLKVLMARGGFAGLKGSRERSENFHAESVAQP